MVSVSTNFVLEGIVFKDGTQNLQMLLVVDPGDMEIQAVKCCGLGQDSRKWLWFSDVDSENRNQYN